MSRKDYGCGCHECYVVGLEDRIREDRIRELEWRLERLEDTALVQRMSALGYVSVIRPWMRDRDELRGAVSIVERVHGGEVSLADE